MSPLRQLLPYVKRYRWHFILGSLFVTISNLCSTAAPHILGDWIDSLPDSKNSRSVSSFLIPFLLYYSGSGFFMFLTRRTIIVASRKIEYDLRNDLTTAISKKRAEFFWSKTVGSLMALSSNDIPAVREFVGPAVMYSANTLTTFLFIGSALLAKDPILTLVSLLPLPFIASGTYLIGRHVHRLFKDSQQQFEVLTSTAQETFSGVRTVKSFLREEHRNAMFRRSSDSLLQKNLKLARVQSLTMPAMMVLIGLSNIIVLGYGGWRVIHGLTSLGTLSQFFIYLNQLIWPVAAIGWVVNLIQRGSASIERIMDVVRDNEQNATEDEELSHSRFGDGEIVFENVSVRYHNANNNALTNVNLTVPARTSLGIIGSIGSGKTTFVSLLSRIIEPTSGRILIDGEDISLRSIASIRDAVSTVQQEAFLFSDTISENIRFGNSSALDSDINESVKSASLEKDVQQFPKGLATIVGERGVTLSGGQKQRTSIARAFVKKYLILVLDDPLSSVDSETEKEIRTAITNKSAQQTTVIVSHKISTVQSCDRIAVFESSSLADFGTHQELLDRKGYYFDLYQKQSLEQEIENL